MSFEEGAEALNKALREHPGPMVVAAHSMLTALPAGRGDTRTVLFDSRWRQVWDSATATTPAYEHITDSLNAVVDGPYGRWSGIVYRCPEGIKRWSWDDLAGVLIWDPEDL